MGVDLIHCERQAAAAVAASGGRIRLLQGELITDGYLDSVATEIDETLQVIGARDAQDARLSARA